MAWSWAYEDASGAATGSSQEFPAQADAETWIGESWRELLESGVSAVTLREGDRVVYGPMGLEPA